MTHVGTTSLSYNSSHIRYQVRCRTTLRYISEKTKFSPNTLN